MPKNLALLLGERRPRPLYKERDHVEKVAAVLVDLALALAAGAALDYLEHALQLGLAAEVLGVGGEPLHEVAGYLPGGDGRVPDSVVEAGVHAVAGGPPPVLLREVLVVWAPGF